MREIGEGQFGKVLLMKAQVWPIIIIIVYKQTITPNMATMGAILTCVNCLSTFNVVIYFPEKGIAGYTGKIPVAVKTLTSRDLEVVRKFMEEADLMKTFSHPNIVSLLGK